MLENHATLASLARWCKMTSFLEFSKHCAKAYLLASGHHSLDGNEMKESKSREATTLFVVQECVTATTKLFGLAEEEKHP